MISNLKINISNLILRFPFLGAIISQVLSLFILRNLLILSNSQVPIIVFVFLQSILSVSISIFIFKLPKWFFIISFLFPFLFLIDVQFFRLSSGVYGILFTLFALTFSHTLKERVPLYLSNQTTFLGLRKIIQERQARSFIDLGSGLGGVVRAVSKEKINAIGIETAPVLWLISKIISFGKGKIIRQNIWDADLSKYDVIYAFLSPAIMDKLYKKVQLEMRPDAIFVSNSFVVEGVLPEQVWQLEDSRKTQLYFYKKII